MSWSWHVCWDDVVKCNLLENSWDYFKRELVDGRVLDGRAHRQLDHVLQTHKKNSDETRSRKITRKSEERNICRDSPGRTIELYSRATGNYSYSAWLVQSRHEMAPLILSLRLKSLTSNYSQSLTLLLSVTVTATVSSNDDKQRTNELWLILKVLWSWAQRNCNDTPSNKLAAAAWVVTSNDRKEIDVYRDNLSRHRLTLVTSNFSCSGTRKDRHHIKNATSKTFQGCCGKPAPSALDVITLKFEVLKLWNLNPYLLKGTGTEERTNESA